MTRWILGVVLALAVLDRFHEDARAVLPRPLAVRPRVIHPHHNGMVRLARTRRTPIAPHVGDDQGAVAEPELRPVVLPAEDMTAALDVLARQLRTQITGYGQPGNPVAGFVRAARQAWGALS